MTFLTLRQSFLLFGTLVITISPLLSCTLYCGAAVSTLFNWPKIKITKEKKVVAVLFLIISFWFYFRKVLPEDVSLGVVAFTDYVPFFIFFYLLSLFPFSEEEVLKFSFAFILTIPQQFLIGYGEKYLNWRGRFFFPKDNLPLIDIFVGPIEPGLDVSASFYNPNILALYCIISIIFSISLFLFNIKKIYNLKKISIKLVLKTLIISSCLLLSLILLVWTRSRNGWFAFFFVVVLYLWIYNKKYFFAIFGLVIVFLVVILLINPNWFPNIIKIVIPNAIWEKLSIFSIDRGIYYDFALKLIKEKPFWGWGLGMYTIEAGRQLNFLGYRVLHAHNIILQLGTEVGLILTTVLTGLISYLVISSYCYATIQPLNENRIFHIEFGFLIAVTTIILMQLFDLTILMTYRLNFIFWICLAISYSKITKF